ncbi:unnamed protein product, partial [Discosporangium mesarthrocarpum]
DRSGRGVGVGVGTGGRGSCAEGEARAGVGLGVGGQGPGLRRMRSVRYQPTQSDVLDVNKYKVGPDDVFVEQGRRVVCLHEMKRRPVYWAYSGQGDDVQRAVWMQDTGSRPIPHDTVGGKGG